MFNITATIKDKKHYYTGGIDILFVEDNKLALQMSLEDATSHFVTLGNCKRLFPKIFSSIGDIKIEEV